MRTTAPDESEEKLGLGLSLTVLQLFVYFSFILTSCFSANSLSGVVPGIDLPLSFVFGLVVIFFGTGLTILYVVRVNATENN